MSDFKDTMHQIQFWLGSAPDPARGAYSLTFFLRIYGHTITSTKKAQSK